MFQSVADFFRRHQSKFVTTGVMVGATYALGKYVQFRLEELYEEKDQERKARSK